MLQNQFSRVLEPTNKKTTQAVIDAASSIILGKQHQIKLSLACVLAGGHLLIEDLPGKKKRAHLGSSTGRAQRRYRDSQA